MCVCVSGEELRRRHGTGGVVCVLYCIEGIIGELGEGEGEGGE